jgi:pilus assembly protein TadC
LAPLLERLAADARQMRRRRFDERARRLPVRLAVPLVLCTLPSFALLTVVPLLLAALTSLHR